MKYATGTSKNRAQTHSALRIGIVQNGHLIEERKLQDCAQVTVGQSPRNLFTLSAQGLPRTYQVFRKSHGRQILRFAPSSDGRVTIDGNLRTLRQACASGAAQRVGDWYELPLQPGARGKLTLGEVTVLFQQIHLPPSIPQPRLPASLQGGLSHRMDPVFSWVLSGSLAMAAIFLLAVQLVPKPSGTLRSSRIKALLGNRAQVEHSKPAVPKPGAVVQKQQPGQQVGEPTTTPGKTSPSTHRNPNGDPGARTPTRRVVKGSAEYAALMNDLTNIQLDDDRMAAIAIAGKCSTPAECARAAAGPDHLRNGASIGRDLDDRAQRPGGIVSTRPTGPSSHTRRTTLANTGGRPVVSTTRTNPTNTTPRPRPRPIKIKPPQGATAFKPPTGRPRGGAAISTKVRQRVYGLRYCYNRLLPSQPTLKGAVKISFMVLPNGRVRSVAISTGMGASMKSCVQSKVARWHLGKPKITGPVFYGPFYVRFYPRG